MQHSCQQLVNRNHMRLAAAIVFLMSLPVAAAKGDLLRIEVPAPGGVVSWEELGVRIADAARLDGDALRSTLPSGRLKLNSSSTRWTFAAIHLATHGGLSCRVVRSTAGESCLRVDVDRAWVRRQYSRLERAVRPDPHRHGCRLSVPDRLRDQVQTRELVLLVHGFNSTPKSLGPLQTGLERTGFVCGDFRYPNDGSLEEAAVQLSRELRALSDQLPALRVAIVAHSMGGLVARRVVEDPELNPVCVSRLIQIATPNHGSTLAYLPCGLDLWEHLGPGKSHSSDLEHVLTAWIADGLEEARHDLQPDSPWLAQLNARPRNPRVAYSILLGDAGPFAAEELEQIRTTWKRLCERETTVQLFCPRIDPILDGGELRQGTGDGAVSIASGRLEGVPDVVVLPCQHDCIQKGLRGTAGEQLIEAVLSRIPLTVAPAEAAQFSPKK